jgi:hypothetical protein
MALMKTSRTYKEVKKTVGLQRAVFRGRLSGEIMIRADQ